MTTPLRVLLPRPPYFVCSGSWDMSTGSCLDCLGNCHPTVSCYLGLLDVRRPERGFLLPSLLGVRVLLAQTPHWVLCTPLGLGRYQRLQRGSVSCCVLENESPWFSEAAKLPYFQPGCLGRQLTAPSSPAYHP